MWAKRPHPEEGELTGRYGDDAFPVERSAAKLWLALLTMQPASPLRLSAAGFATGCLLQAKLALEKRGCPRYVEEMATRLAHASPLRGCSSVG